MEDNQLKFQKYASKGNQEFIITPNDEFEVKSLKVDNAASRFLDSPDFVIEEIYTNNSSLAQELTTNVSKKRLMFPIFKKYKYKYQSLS